MKKLISWPVLLIFVALVSLTVVVTVSAAATAPLVVPNSLATIEGNSNNGFPFNIANIFLSSMRYQQVFAASEFGTQPLTITQITFRPDGGAFGTAFSSTLSNVQINLSKTSAAPDGLSSTFADNVGGDDTVVFPSGPLALSSLNTGSGPRDFDIVINLTTPFVYDPSEGNLLFGVRNFSGGFTTQFDSHSASDPVSRVFIGDVGSPTGNLDTHGLVAKFTFDDADHDDDDDDDGAGRGPARSTRCEPRGSPTCCGPPGRGAVAGYCGGRGWP